LPIVRVRFGALLVSSLLLAAATAGAQPSRFEEPELGADRGAAGPGATADDGRPAGRSGARGEGRKDGEGDDAAGQPAVEVTHYAFDVEAPDDVRELIETRTLIGRWRHRREYDPEQFDALYSRLREEVETIMQSRGYFDSTIDISGDRRAVRVKVHGGPRATINRVELSIVGPAADDPELVRRTKLMWQLPEGEFFNTERWELGKRNLLDALRQQGFLRARISDSRATADAAATTVALRVQVDSGTRLAFGKLRINGLSRYSPQIVEALQPYDVGDPYSFEQVQLFQARLRDAGYFSSAYVYVDEAAYQSDPSLVRVPMIVDLNERRTQRAVFGVGYSTDQGARTQAGYQHRNLFDRAWRLDSGVILEQSRQRAYGTVTTPTTASGHFFATGMRFESLDVQNVRNRKSTVFFGQGRRRERVESFASLQYQIESEAIDDGQGGLIRDSRRALTPIYSWTYRVLDSRVDPRDGYAITTQLSGALKGLLTDRSFARVYSKGSLFIPMNRETPSKAGQFVGTLELGYVASDSRQNIPSENLFRAGGAQSLRGYAFQSLGVRIGEAVVGGRVLAIATAEYQHPVADNWWLAGFVDIGNAADRLGEYKAVKGYGVGVRARTPVGPVNVDLAYGQADRRFRLHFSVGYAF
jgi:translocation and assembly module TamA